MDKTTTRSTLSEAVFKNVGLSRNESANLVDSVFNEILMMDQDLFINILKKMIYSIVNYIIKINY